MDVLWQDVGISCNWCVGCLEGGYWIIVTWEEVDALYSFKLTVDEICLFLFYLFGLYHMIDMNYYYICFGSYGYGFSIELVKW